jgi:hypothetical protein
VTHTFRLRSPSSQIPHWAARYDDDDTIVERVAPRARARGYLKRGEFLDLCYWKSPRTLDRALWQYAKEKQG